MATKLEDIDLSSLTVKQKNHVTTSDMTNEFISEDLVLCPLYKKISIDNKLKSYKFFPYNDLRLECYCNKCKTRRIFAFENSKYALIPMGINEANDVANIFERIDYFRLIALADCSHELVMLFKVIDEKTITKIGQYPSIYDMNEEINNKAFLKFLDKEYQEYYKTACSLFSFNSCIGAMTYLRRIFEKLLIDTFKENEDKLAISFEAFKKERIEDKVKTLKSYLPNIIQDNGFNGIYTKISDGIHNLTEEECASMFNTLKCGIEEILIEKLTLREKAKRQEEIAKKLQKIH